MASTTVKPYPHIQMNVKDNSIATINMVETLPVHRPLYVMKTKKGPVGRPVWCPTYSKAAAIFGAETFDPANKNYYSKASAYLRETFTNNGAFISRYLPVDYTQKYTAENTSNRDLIGYTMPENVILAQATASSLLYAEVKRADVPKYDIDIATGERVQEFNGTEWVDKQNGTVPGISIVYRTRAIKPSDHIDPDDPSSAIKMTAVLKDGVLTAPIAAFVASDPGEYGNDLAYKLFYSPKSNDASDVGSYKTIFYNIGFAEREDANSTWNPIVDIYNRESCAFAANPDTVNPDTGASMGIDNVLDKGFSDDTHQLPVSFEINEENLNLIGLIVAAYADDTIDNYDPVTGKYTPYDDAGTKEYIEGYKTLNGYGNAVIGGLDTNDKHIVTSWFEGTVYNLSIQDMKDPTFGYKVNVISGTNLLNVPYDHVMINKEVASNPYDGAEPAEEQELDPEGDLVLDADELMNGGGSSSSGSDTSTSTVSGATPLNMNYHIALDGGNDGTFIPDDVYRGTIVDGKITAKNSSSADPLQASNDYAMYRFVKLQAAGVRDEIVESLHYPFTHIFDVGYSFKTKKAMIDFLDVRDDVMVILSTQVLMSDGSGRSITINAQDKDEGNGEALRAYALLMRESVLYGTDCMRCSIYCHCGRLVDTTTYNGVLPFTYWAAVKYSQYGNLTYMKQDEPRGLPNSFNLLFKDWNWWNYRADSQSRVWDNGANYVQYADMTRIFFPALRTVYRAATSVLVDEWFVAAVVYAKYVCRRAWATFSGRNDSATVLQGAIKKYLDTELAALFNSKYTFSVSVYQTAEEQELGYIQHVKLSITSGATMRVLDVDIEVNRENFVAEE